jgi:hypothetical protein
VQAEDLDVVADVDDRRDMLVARGPPQRVDEARSPEPAAQNCERTVLVFHAHKSFRPLVTP